MIILITRDSGPGSPRPTQGGGRGVKPSLTIKESLDEHFGRQQIITQALVAVNVNGKITGMHCTRPSETGVSNRNMKRKLSAVNATGRLMRTKRISDTLVVPHLKSSKSY